MRKPSVHNLFYVSPEKIVSNTIEIGSKELHHIKNVLRKKVGDTIFFTDGMGNRYTGTITHMSRSRVSAEILDKVYVQRANTAALTLAFVPLKGSRNEIILEKGTELGVMKFLVFRSVFSEIPALNNVKLRRFRNIATSAMLQSLRYYMPEIIYHDDINALVNCFDTYDCVLLADRNGKRRILREAGSVLYIVGPEGGFDDSEIEGFKKNGAQLLSLGKTRLRSETAAIAGIVKILAALGTL